MKKLNVIIAILCVVSLLFAFTACNTPPPLSEKFDKAIVEKTAENFVSLVNAGKAYETFELLSTDMKEAISKDKLVEALNNGLDKLGEFQSSTYSVYGGVNAETKEDYATCVVISKYKNGNRQYTLTVNEELEFVGVFVK